MPDRIETIRKLLERSPRDAFLHYSLAMELWSAGRRDDALAQFARCAETDPEYLPALVEWGKALRSAGKRAEAKEVLTRALALAQKLSQRHTEDYITQQLEGLP